MVGRGVEKAKSYQSFSYLPFNKPLVLQCVDNQNGIAGTYSSTTG